MRIKDWTPTYLFTYLLFYLGMYGYYKRIKIEGKKNIPKNKPLIFASNHQNSLVDPCVIAVTSGGKPVHFLARSDVFKKKTVAKILGTLNMMPIYRPRDGADFQEKNVAIFNQCHEILNRHGRIIIFPEGSHDKRKHLRNVKAGVANISLGAKEKYGDLDIYIVPVGLNFSNTDNKWADLYVRYGKPMKLSDYLAQEQPVSEIMKDLREKMSDEMIDFKQVEYYPLYDYLFYKSGVIEESNLYLEFNERKQKIKEFENWLAKQKEEEIQKRLEQVNQVETYCEEKKIKPYLLNQLPKSLLIDYLFLIVGFPFFLYGWLNNEIAYRAPRRVNKLLKDEQFHSSIYLIVGAFLSGVLWTIQTLVFYFFICPDYWLAYLISLPITGWFAFRYYIFSKKLFGKHKYNKLCLTNNKDFTEIKKLHKELKGLIA